MSNVIRLAALQRDVEKSGFYPSIVIDVLDIALAGEDLLDHLVHVETTFVMGEVHRHVTVLLLTDTRLIVGHVDDHTGNHHETSGSAAASTESVSLAAVRTVALTYGVNEPTKHKQGALPSDVTLGICWGTVTRIDLEPATCGDPECQNEHGLTGSMTPDDLQLRVSGVADGVAALESAIRFAKALSGATAGVNFSASIARRS